MTRDELYKLIDILDKHMKDDVPPAEVQVAWTLLRTELRHRRSQSEQALPRVAAAAQALSTIREASEAGLSSLGAMVSPPPDSDEK